jgi:hypothetical protein
MEKLSPAVVGVGLLRYVRIVVRDARERYNFSIMDERTVESPKTESVAASGPVSGRWRRYARRAAVAVLVVAVVAAILLREHIRTLRSLRQVPGTNAYVMDYYVDYNIDEIRANGMDVANVEDGLIDVFFPDVIAAIARNVKGAYLDEPLETTTAEIQRCSTVALHAPGGHAFFGRNFDWMHDACLIVRVHKDGVPTTLSVIDLHYLNLDRDDLEATSILERIPLLFAPYYLQDGMNQYGVAVSDMSVDGVKAPHDDQKPNVIHSTAMRLILDYAKTADEAIDILKQYNIHYVGTTCHLMIADATGKSAVVEFIDGKMEVTPGNEYWQVCTNHQICDASEEHSNQTCDRYRTASEQLAKASAAAGPEDVMKVMEAVSKQDWTMWSSVYDLTDHTLRFAYRRHFDKPYACALVE